MQFVSHFWNMQRRDPDPDVDPRNGVTTMKAIQRAILDLFWSPEPTTMNANRRERKHVDKAKQAYGVDEEPRGCHQHPFPVRGDWGMLKPWFYCTVG